jgi:hypothetical protein
MAQKSSLFIRPAVVYSYNETSSVDKRRLNITNSKLTAIIIVVVVVIIIPALHGGGW